MIGDKLLVNDYHRAGARQVMDALRPRLANAAGPIAVTVAGESGSGKSEIAQCLAEALAAEDVLSVVFGQDDYFRLPPRSNHEKRLDDLSWVGTGEVRLDLLDEHVAAVKADPSAPLEKPIVNFDENRLGTEILEPVGALVVIAEGTYTSLLASADLRAFIDRTYDQNRANRLRRARDPDPEFLERVLGIEHAIISKHKAQADVVIDAPEEERGS